jgi:hypothetical protein
MDRRQNSQQGCDENIYWSKRSFSLLRGPHSTLSLHCYHLCGLLLCCWGFDFKVLLSCAPYHGRKQHFHWRQGVLSDVGWVERVLSVFKMLDSKQRYQRQRMWSSTMTSVENINFRPEVFLSEDEVLAKTSSSGQQNFGLKLCFAKNFELRYP